MAKEVSVIILQGIIDLYDEVRKLMNSDSQSAILFNAPLRS